MNHLKQLMSVIYIILLFIPSIGYSIEIPTADTASGTVSLDISTDKNDYKTGEIIQFTIEMSGEELVDIYITATFPDGSFSSYSTSLMPDAENSIIPMLKGVPLSDFSGKYTLPLPVIPLWPEGISEILVVFVKAKKNPMLSVNWLASDMVTFSIDQSDDISPLVDLENKVFTAPLGEIGTIEIAFGNTSVEDGIISGSVEGSIFLTGPAGTTYERELSGTYSYKDETLTVHLEGEESFYIDIYLAINEDGTLTGTYETVDGKSGEIELTVPAASLTN